MKKTCIIISAVIFVLFILMPGESFAQRGPRKGGWGGWGPGTAYGRLYNPQTVETLSGEVVKVEKFSLGRGISQGIHLLLKTEKETIPVHLGPAWYIDNQEVKIAPKDRIEVKGSRITYDGKPAIIAAEIKKDDQVLKLRDENGYPVWSGWRRVR